MCISMLDKQDCQQNEYQVVFGKKSILQCYEPRRVK